MTLTVFVFVAIFLGLVGMGMRALALPGFPGRSDYLQMVVSAGWWTLAAILDANASMPEVKVFFSELAWYGIITTPIFWMLFISAYVRGYDHPRAAMASMATVAFGVLVLVTALTNDAHHLIYTSVVPDPSEAYPDRLTYHHGPAYFLLATTIYLLMLAVTLRALRAAVDANSVHRMQYFGLVVTSLVPWAANAAYNFGGLRILGFDPTPLAFSVLPLFYNWLIVRRGLFSMAPIAMKAVFGAHPDAVIVTTLDGTMVELNAAARALMPGTDEPVGVNFVAFAQLFRPIRRPEHGLGDQPAEMWSRDDKTYEIRIVPVLEGGVERARVYVLREVSDLLRTQRELHVAARLMQERLDANIRLQEQLRDLAVRDSLTGLHNRRIIDEVGDRLAAGALGSGRPLTAVSLDLDHFKQINDGYGHKAGDDVLVTVGDVLAASLRPNELAIRMGGEEFLVLMPGVTPEEGGARAEAWRLLLRARPVPTAAGTVSVTFSAGVACIPGHAHDFEALLQRVDKAVYAAKNEGRDRVVILRDGVADAA